uniref:Uncharacterized protein n=1 Tax=Cacopsylla melanoneura TaxID=428564 RepID=A0A8D8ZH00_9HEMI
MLIFIVFLVFIFRLGLEGFVEEGLKCLSLSSLFFCSIKSRSFFILTSTLSSSSPFLSSSPIFFLAHVSQNFLSFTSLRTISFLLTCNHTNRQVLCCCLELEMSRRRYFH